MRSVATAVSPTESGPPLNESDREPHGSLGAAQDSALGVTPRLEGKDAFIKWWMAPGVRQGGRPVVHLTGSSFISLSRGFLLSLAILT